VRQVLGQVPGQLVVDADATLGVHRHHQGQWGRQQTATGALIAGCGW
jgi:hypothetical protein